MMTISPRLIETYHSALRVMLPKSRTFWAAHSYIQRKAIEGSKVYEGMLGRLSSGLALNADDVVLDAGCGRGDWLVAISPKVGRAIGVDYEAGMLCEAKRRTAGLSNILIERVNLDERLPFSDSFFRKIGSTMVYGYLGGGVEVLKEYHRILAPGGMIGLFTPREGARFIKVLIEEVGEKRKSGSIFRELSKLPLAAAVIFFSRIAELKGDVGQFRFLSREELADDLTSAGFIIKSIEPDYVGQAWFALAMK